MIIKPMVQGSVSTHFSLDLFFFRWPVCILWDCCCCDLRLNFYFYITCSRKHLVALLNFRGLVRGREHQLILQRFKELKQKVDSRNGRVDRSRMLFGDMQVNVNTGFLSSAPMFCFHFLLPDSWESRTAVPQPPHWLHTDTKTQCVCLCGPGWTARVGRGLRS